MSLNTKIRSKEGCENCAATMGKLWEIIIGKDAFSNTMVKRFCWGCKKEFELETSKE
ncbi:hypothetical protein LCGC14_1924280 [marine sediment metagenome]|uniref:Uncharacterized protein n=1 Tax=marine sediment metagenome TaxID=412755 RepID=A0A0F9I3R6_9ZZZZ